MNGDASSTITTESPISISACAIARPGNSHPLGRPEHLCIEIQRLRRVIHDERRGDPAVPLGDRLGLRRRCHLLCSFSVAGDAGSVLRLKDDRRIDGHDTDPEMFAVAGEMIRAPSRRPA